MPNEQMEFLPSSELMSAEEIANIAKEFVSLGINKIRLTGGEPLLRKDFPEILQNLSQLPVELTFTSNGILVPKYIQNILDAGIKSATISLDSLDSDKFFKLTQRNDFQKVWESILLLLSKKIHVKLNVVLMKGENENEVNQFVALTKELPIHVRFIEFMPFTGNHWEKAKVMTKEEILGLVATEYDFIKLVDEKHETAKKYQVKNHLGTFAIITTMSEPFCGDCNRIRLTADGKIKNCLFSREESDLLGKYRNGEEVISVIKKSILEKKWKQGGQFASTYGETDANKIVNRSMIHIGG
jgi:molybdenum cofactor biosynthesis protein A